MVTSKRTHEGHLPGPIAACVPVYMDRDPCLDPCFYKCLPNTSKSDSVSCGVAIPFPWVPMFFCLLCFLPSKCGICFSQFCGSSAGESYWPLKSDSLGKFLVCLLDPQAGKPEVRSQNLRNCGRISLVLFSNF